MAFSVDVENIKCGGCANSIRSAFDTDVEVDIDNGCVTFNLDQSERDAVVEKLKSLGYPEVGSMDGLNRMTSKARSFVSCAVGRTVKKER